VGNVLLVGPWSPSALAFARSATRVGLGVYLLQASAQNSGPRSGGSLLGATVMSPRLVGTQEGINFIKRYAAEAGVSAVVATVDRELVWLAAHRHEFEPSIAVLVPPAEALCAILSKQHQLDLARRAGLSVLPTYLLSRPEDADLIPVLDYPLVLRPDREENVEPGFKARIVKSPEGLHAAMSACRRLTGVIIAQPFRHLPNLLVHAVRSVTGDVIASR